MAGKGRSSSMTRVVIVGGGMSGLAAAYRLHKLDPNLKLTLIEREERLGGKILTDALNGFVLEGAADSFLARKVRGVGFCEELGIADQLYGRDPRHAKTFVKSAGELYPLPSGLSGMIPTNLDALANNPLISTAGKERLAQETTLPPRPQNIDNDDESVASFVSRRLGREVYEKLVEPLMSGIYAGNGDLLSLAATFPQLRQLELKHGSLLKGLTAAPEAPTGQKYPPFVSLTGGMATLVNAILEQLPADMVVTGRAVMAVSRHNNQYRLTLDHDAIIDADALILATPAFVTARLLEPIDATLAAAHAAIPYASSAIVTLAYEGTTPQPEGYGYVIPRIATSDVLACTISSNKWRGRAPDDGLLVRVYLGRFGQRDVTQCSDAELLALAQQEVADTLALTATPAFHRIYRWPLSMPQYTLGHMERLCQIDARLADQPGLLLAGAAYRGVGIPDCIREGEDAAQAAVRYLEETKRLRD
jgi:oxygen-dependent protoporphyrinogen oxidase